MNKLRYALYMRKSTEEAERQMLSLDSQRDKIFERYGDLNIVIEFRESKSAAEPNKRPKFREMIELIDEGKIDGIIAWHPDRLSRNEMDAAEIGFRARKGIIQDLKFVSGFTFENTPEGIMMLQFTMAQSQHYSAKLSKDVRRGNEKKRQLGGLTGLAPQGYLNINGQVVIDEQRFPLIRKAYDLFLTGEYSVNSILTIMNEEWGYKSLRRSKSGDTPLSRPTLYHILRNVRYAGIIPDTYNPEKYYKANFPALITLDEYDRVQSLLGRKGLPRLTSKKQFALRGFIHCGDCGCAITAQTKRKVNKQGIVKIYTYYHCTGKRKGCSQKSTYVNEVDLYEQLNELLNNYELLPEMFDWAMQTFREFIDKEASQRDNIQSMQNKSITDIQNQLDRLLDMATRGMIDDDDFNSKSISLKASLKTLQEEQADTSLRVKNWYEIATETLEKLVNARIGFAEGEYSDKRDILLAIGQNPVLFNGRLDITPNKWLSPIKDTALTVRNELDMVRKMPQQIQKASEEAVMSTWRRR